MSGPARPTSAYAMAQRRAPAARSCGGRRTLQPKLDVTPAGDRYEAEADRVAAQVMGPGTAPVMPQISSLIGSPGGQRAAKEGTAANAKKKEDLKEKESSGKAAQKKAKEPAQDEKKPKAAQKKTKAPVKDEKKGSGAQKKAKDEAPAKNPQKKSKPEEPEKKAQRDASGRGFSAPSATEGAIDSMQRAGGVPLEAGTRSFMEHRIGRDFSGVQIHDTPAAHRAADDLGAHAFTVGKGVFFARGAYRPDTGEGRRLIAHELTHTVQQVGGSAQAKRAQRAAPKTPPPSTTTPAAPTPAPPTNVWQPAGAADKLIDFPNKKIVAPSLKLPLVNGIVKGADISATTTAAAVPPSTKIALGQEFTRDKPTERKGKSQRERWFEGAIGDSSITSGLQSKIDTWATGISNGRTPMTAPSGKEILFARRKGSRSVKATSVNELLIGTSDELAKQQNMLLPSWDRKGDPRVGPTAMQADHIQELQHGGAHDWSNLSLLHGKANMAVGPAAQGAWNEPLKGLLDEAEKDGFWAAGKGGKRPSIATLANAWRLTFKTIVAGKNYTGEAFLKEDIKTGEQLNGLTLMTDKERIDTGVGPADPSVQPDHFSIFAYSTGGKRWDVIKDKKDPKKWKLNYSGKFLGGFDNLVIDYDWSKGPGSVLGKIEGDPTGGRVISYPHFDIPLINNPALGYSVYLDPEKLKIATHGSQFPGLSPLEFDEFGLDAEGLLAGSGRIKATAYLFPGLEIPISVRGDEITLDFPIPTENLKLGPVSVDQAALNIGFGSNGVFLGGSADISVNQLGSGHLDAKAGEKGPRIEGDFNFDFNFLDKPSAKFLYDMGEDKLELTLEAAVQKDKIPGVQSGNITAKFSKEETDVTGTLQPVGFLSAAIITVSYTREQGLKMEATDVPLPLGNLPAVKDAKVTVGAQRSPQGDWAVYGGGSATFALPAVTGSIALLVKDDILTFTGTGNVAKGPASGTLNFTATNQALDEQGQPLTGPSLDHFRTWGKGSVTVSFGKIITGTAEIELTETNEIIVKGGIALPPTFEVFPIKEYEKQLLHVEPPEFPIWGVSVAGVGIGIFAFVDANLNFDAFVGPGQLKDTDLEFSYNFMKPEEASVDGNANFDVPAGAGFTLDIGGGVRARLATAQVSGRVGLDGRLGIEANAGANVKVHWDPVAGLELNANAYAKASPKFEIGANASVTASVDLLLAEPSYTWGPWRRQLGSFGPSLSVGIEFPVSWSEKNGLDLSLDNIKVTKPDIDPMALMKDAFLELV